MKSKSRILVNGTRGDDVRLVQEQLRRLGFRIPASETRDAVFGPRTQAAVRKIQEKAGLKATGVVNRATARAIDEQIASRAANAERKKAPRKAAASDQAGTAGESAPAFKVTGTVTSPERSVVGVLRVEIVAKQAGPDVALAETETDARGRYAVEFPESKVPAELAPPDLQARVFADKTFLAASEIRYDATSPAVLDASVPANTPGLPSEYESLLSALEEHYQGKLRDLEESGERQDVTYLANKTGCEVRTVAMAAAADELAAESGLHPAFYYALLRAGLPAEPDGLYQTDPETSGGIWKTAIAQGLIPKSLEGKVAEARRTFHKLAATHVLETRTAGGTSSLKEIVELTLRDEEQQQKFAELYTRHRNDLPKLWTEARKAFGAETAERLQLDGQLGVLTLNNAPLIKALRAKVSTTEDLVKGGFYRAEAWKALVAKSPIPEQIPGESEEERRANYAGSLAEKVRQSFPKAVIAEKVRKKESKVSSKVKKKVVESLAAPEGELAAGRRAARVVARATESDPAAGERVYQITPTDEAADGLLDSGMDSAYKIVRYEEEEFVRLFKDKVGGEAAARQIYARARQVHNTVLNAAVSYLVARNAPGLGMTPAAFVIPGAADVLAYPTLDEIFGSMDYCACEHCRSVLSPAAYLVDLLQFIDHTDQDDRNPQQVLLDRRPDLQHLPLTCENTNTPVPYIDLVNEVLEYFVAHNLSLTAYEGYDTGGKTSEELLANPQFVNETAYNTLKSEIFPPPLPFHKPLETLRRYFEKHGIPLHEAMEALHKEDALDRPNAAGYSWRDILMERLKLSRDEYRLLTDRTLFTVQQLYGLGASADPLVELVKAKPFTRRVGITYEELVEILKTQLMRRLGPIVLFDTAHSADLFTFDSLEFRRSQPDASTVPLLKFHYVALLRFIRLWKKLGLTIAQTDQLIAALFPPELQRAGANEAEDLDLLDRGFLSVLPRIGAIFQVMERLELTPERDLQDLLACWSPPVPGGSSMAQAWLARKLRLSLAELQALIRCTGLNPFVPGVPQPLLLLLVDLVDALAAAGLKPAQAIYLIWNEDLSGKSAPDDRLITGLARKLRAGFAAVESELGAAGDAEGKLARKRQQALAIASGELRTDPAFTQALFTNKDVLQATADAAKPALDDLLVLESTATGGVAIRGSLSGYLEAPQNGSYNLRIETQADAPLLQLRIDGTAVELERSGNVWSTKRPVELKAGNLHQIDLFETASTAALFWQTEGLDWQEAPERSFYSGPLINQLRATAIRLLKASALASALKMTANEIVHFATRSEYQIGGKSWLNYLFLYGRLGDPTVLMGALSALLGFARLKSELSPDDERLLAALKNPDAVQADGRSLLLTLTGWEADSRDAFLARFGLTVLNLTRVELLSRVHTACRLQKKLGIPAVALLAAATNEPTAGAVEAFQTALRARYDASAWRSLVRPVNDELRGLQRDALVASILRKFSQIPASRHIDTPEKLFEYFLMDVEMEPCMQTSRVRHALSSAQLFIERCLMNLEPRVPPALINAKHWEWMKRYRVWEANRKVYLFPENWLEPELRDDQSPFFKESMGELLQGDITDDTAATALLNYLSKLDEIAKLEPCEIHYREGQAGKGNDVAHVVARTTGANRKYYYRRREAGSWTPWEQIKLDIEDNPVKLTVWQGRLFLFWVKLLKKGPQNLQMPRAGAISTLNTWDVQTPWLRVEAVLCWSEYFNGKWQPARTSDPEQPSLLNAYFTSFDRRWLAIDCIPDADGLRVRMNYYRSGFRLYNTYSHPTRMDELPVEQWTVNPLFRTFRETGVYYGDYYNGSWYPGALYVQSGTIEGGYYTHWESGVLLQIQTRPQGSLRTLDPARQWVYSHLHLQFAWLAPFLFEHGNHLFYVTTRERPAALAASSAGASAPAAARASFAAQPSAVPARQLAALPGRGSGGPSRFARFLNEAAHFNPGLGKGVMFQPPHQR
jgi:hypothetical protein